MRRERTMRLRGRTYEDAGKRVRTALVVLIAGVVLLLAGLGMAWLRGPVPADPRIVRSEKPEPAPAPADEAEAVRTGVVLLVISAVLAVTLLVACYALFRVTRRYAALEQRKAFQPTAAEDVWEMHKLPEEPLEEPPEGADSEP